MIRKLMFAAGAGIGYVLGTRAGRKRYDEMAAATRGALGRGGIRADPEVKDAKGPAGAGLDHATTPAPGAGSVPAPPNPPNEIP